MDLADGTTVPDRCVQALEELETRWPGSSFSMARGAIVKAVLQAYTQFDVVKPATPPTSKSGVSSSGDSRIPYDREVLSNILIYHRRRDSGGCMCGLLGWSASYVEHVTHVYENTIRLRDL